jgi:Zn-dependent protease
LDFQLAYPLEKIPYLFLALIIALTLHEFAHAYTAYLFGDPTAKNEGRVTLNPLVHLDWIGTVMIFLIGFGWAKPVPVNRYYFKHRFAGVLTTLAGPLSNLFLAFISFFLWYLMIQLNLADLSIGKYSFYEQLNTIISLNIVIFVFNLLPFPPLDGYRIIEDLVSNDMRAKMTQYEYIGVILFLILAITPLGRFVFDPIFNIVVPFIISIFNAILPV